MPRCMSPKTSLHDPGRRLIYASPLTCLHEDPPREIPAGSYTLVDEHGVIQIISQTEFLEHRDRFPVNEPMTW